MLAIARASTVVTVPSASKRTVKKRVVNGDSCVMPTGGPAGPLGEAVVARKAAVVFRDDIRQIVEGVRRLQAGEREDRAKEHDEHREK